MARTSFPPRETARPDERKCRSRFVELAVLLLFTVVSLVSILVIVQTSSARLYADIGTPWKMNYAMIVEAKKRLLLSCADTILIGDSSGLPVDAGLVERLTGKRFDNLALFGHAGLSGYLSQVSALKAQGCEPDHIVVFLAPETVLKKKSGAAGAFENLFTVLQFGTWKDALATLAFRADGFIKLFNYSSRTMVNYAVAHVRKGVGLSGASNSFIAKLLDVIDGNPPARSEIAPGIDALVHAKGTLAFLSRPLAAGACSVTYGLDGNLSHFRAFQEDLTQFYPMETFTFLGPGVPNCATDFTHVRDLLASAYDRPLELMNASLFVDGIHATPAGGKVLSGHVAQAIQAAAQRSSGKVVGEQ